MFMNKIMQKASYDKESDVLTLYNEKAKVDQSIEVSEEMIIDIDSSGHIVNIELLDAYEFLHALNSSITKKILNELTEVEMVFKQFRNYWMISLAFVSSGKRIEEKLPVFSRADFQSPLLASK